MTTSLTPEILRETFSLMDEWEDRYAYLIDLGRALPPMDPAIKTDDILVKGCTSRVWLMSISCADDAGQVRYTFMADSDAAIVKGLVALVLVCIQGKTAADISAFDLACFFKDLSLEEHLSPNRRSGFYAMIERVKHLVHEEGC
jgi:cysteine desulfuration protein SufE